MEDSSQAQDLGLQDPSKLNELVLSMMWVWLCDNTCFSHTQTHTHTHTHTLSLSLSLSLSVSFFLSFSLSYSLTHCRFLSDFLRVYGPVCFWLCLSMSHCISFLSRSISPFLYLSFSPSLFIYSFMLLQTCT